MLGNDFLLKQQSILVIAAHPDDAEIYAGGTIALACENGVLVHVIIMTDGTIGADNSLDRDKLRFVRREEQKKASKILDFGFTYMWIPDGMVVANLETRMRIVDLIRKWKPTLILTHRLSSGHPDHRAVAQVVIDAIPFCDKRNVGLLSPLEHKPAVLLFWDESPPEFQANVVIDVAAVISKKQEAVNAHASQRGKYSTDYPTHQAKDWASYIGPIFSDDDKKYMFRNIEYAEVFEISPYGGAVE